MVENLASLIPEGWPFLLLAVLVAGVVRGFSGFGTAMVYLPIASQFLAPVDTLISLIVMDLIGPVPVAYRSRKDTAPKELARLLLGFALFLPLGLLALTQMQPTTFQWVVVIATLLLLCVLVTGWRFEGNLTPSMLIGTGGISGLLGGFCGLAGPPVILMYMASKNGPSAVRANLTVFLIAVDVLTIATLYFLFNALSWHAVAVGLMLIAPYMLASFVGARLFNPDHETIYRRVAYAIIALSALSSLPIWR